SQRSEFLHNFPSTSKSCYRKSSPQNLPKYGHVGSDPEIFLSATESNSESRDHFVENQDDSVLLGDFSQCLEESRACKDGSHVSHYFLDNYCSQFMCMVFDEPLASAIWPASTISSGASPSSNAP